MKLFTKIKVEEPSAAEVSLDKRIDELNQLQQTGKELNLTSLSLRHYEFALDILRIYLKHEKECKKQQEINHRKLNILVWLGGLVFATWLSDNIIIASSGSPTMVGVAKMINVLFF